MAASAGIADSGAGIATAAWSRTAWQQTMTAQFDIGAFAGFGVASSWQEAVTSVVRAVAMQWTTGDQLAASSAAINAKRGIADSIADPGSKRKDETCPTQNEPEREQLACPRLPCYTLESTWRHPRDKLLFVGAVFWLHRDRA